MSEAAHSRTYMPRSSEEVMHPSGWALFPTQFEKGVGQYAHDLWELRVLEIKKTGCDCWGHNVSRANCDELC